MLLMKCFDHWFSVARAAQVLQGQRSLPSRISVHLVWTTPCGCPGRRHPARQSQMKCLMLSGVPVCNSDPCLEGWIFFFSSLAIRDKVMKAMGAKIWLQSLCEREVAVRTQQGDHEGIISSAMLRISAPDTGMLSDLIPYTSSHYQ